MRRTRLSTFSGTTIEAAASAVNFVSDDMQLGYKAMAGKEKAKFEGK